MSSLSLSLGVASLLALAGEHMDAARTTGDPVHYARAEAAADAVVALDPESAAALRLRAWIRAGQHRFAEALALAREAVRRAPDDPAAWGAFADALVETGDLEAAVAAVDRMTSLRPSGPSYARVAHLRELTGDRAGALEALDVALRATDPGAASARAWLHAERGNLLFGSGRPDEAAHELERALALEPALRSAVLGLARARAAVGRLAEAAELYAGAQTRRPSPEVAAPYADVLRALGRRDEAQRQEAFLAHAGALDPRVEEIEARGLALLRCERGIDPAGGLALAERELVTRRDAAGWDVVAWCALHAGDLTRARVAMGEALRTGWRDARLFYHAGIIALAAGALDDAEHVLRDALALAPRFDLRGAAEVEAALARLAAR